MPISGSPKEIVHEEMHRFKHGQLHSGSSRGPKVKSRAQAIAIALSEARKSRQRADGGASPQYAGNTDFVDDLVTKVIGSTRSGRALHNAMTDPLLNIKPKSQAQLNAQQQYDMNRAQFIADDVRGEYRDAGGAAGRSTAVQDIINALQQGSAAYGGPSNTQNPMGNATPSAPAPANAPNPNSQMPAPTTGLATGSTTPAATTTAGPQSPVTNTGLGSVVGGPQMILQPAMAGLSANGTLQRQGFAFGGTPTPPWFVRNEQRQMMHTGPILSAVPGRTDRHNMSVPSNSYVFPADFVSHMGENNSLAGMKVLNRMGFNSGPYGTPLPHVGHGMGLPRPPKPMGVSDAGGARGKDKIIGQPTDVVTAGGEYVASPDSIMRVLGTNNIGHAHSVLDKWVMHVRKQHIKKLKGLPPPIKS